MRVFLLCCAYIDGSTGPTGAEGPAGPTGAPGPNPTAVSAYAANTRGSSISPSPQGEFIGLSEEQVLSPDIVMDNGNTVFLLDKAGVYRISYRVTLLSAQPVGTRLVVDGGYEGIVAPSLAISQFENTVTMALPERCTVALQVYSLTSGLPIVGNVQLVGGAAGASVLIVRLSD